MADLLFKWTFPDGVTDGTFARTGTATFVMQEAVTLDPSTIRAVDLSRPYILARPAEGGHTL